MGRSKNKIAVTLLGVLAFGANALAMNQGVKNVKYCAMILLKNFIHRS